ncbi:MAG: sialidase family protein [Pseudomonadota bacterium]
MNTRYMITLLLATTFLYAWPVWQWVASLTQEPATFLLSPLPASIGNRAPFKNEGFINPDPGDKMVHVGSICELSDGRLAAAWYGGTREGAKDVAIFLSMKDPGSATPWSRPKKIVDRVSASRELYRYVKKVGNSIIFAGPGNRLYLIYVTIAAGGWSGSSLNVKISHDAGTTWERSRRLTLSPFLNISELVRNRPLPISFGGFALPIYHECLGNFPEILWIQPGREDHDITFRKSRMTGGLSFIQPSIVAYGSSHATAFYRCRSNEKTVGMAATKDTGTTWAEPKILSLPNPDSALDAILLSDERILLALNDSAQNRENLSLAMSNDRGVNWRRVVILESSPGEEFSYPYMIRARDGRIHMVYTWHRKRIKHVVFNESWINAQLQRTVK